MIIMCALRINEEKKTRCGQGLQSQSNNRRIILWFWDFTLDFTCVLTFLCYKYKNINNLLNITKHHYAFLIQWDLSE